MLCTNTVQGTDPRNSAKEVAVATGDPRNFAAKIMLGVKMFEDWRGRGY